ncbi:hypothetical protein J7E96_06365 [Streptomyces sp. ISL-96]|uniref:hypothetical protein n=1 Tax=Streptomyces sp. ISL-96 TaxID=2819191 RepID=UPI001BE70529|nr:hypothetical protein [Streptomyces sp. ISL-96]MBT2488154.1 hypothetical protein [Streptomyces sp. ISL-96]
MAGGAVLAAGVGTIALRGGDNDAPSDRVKDVARDIARTDENGKVLHADHGEWKINSRTSPTNLQT